MGLRPQGGGTPLGLVVIAWLRSLIICSPVIQTGIVHHIFAKVRGLTCVKRMRTYENRFVSQEYDSDIGDTSGASDVENVYLIFTILLYWPPCHS